MPPLQSRKRRCSADIGSIALDVQRQLSVEDSLSSPIHHLVSNFHEECRRVIDVQPAIRPSTALSAARRKQLCEALDSWDFEPFDLSDDELLHCTLILFDAILRIDGLSDECGITMAQLRPFLAHLAALYRPENQYHNFRHALDTLQSMHVFLSSAGVTPTLSALSQAPGSRWRRTTGPDDIHNLSNGELLVLWITAIGHDVGHPGLSNAFHQRACTPLGRLFPAQPDSPLEQLHALLLTQLLARHRIRLAPAAVRAPVLSTDLAVHLSWMDGSRPLGQALLKAADISNPLRPPRTAARWARALRSEWASQRKLESAIGVPHATPRPAALAPAQAGFLTHVVLPLFVALAEIAPPLSRFADRAAAARLYWSRAAEDSDDSEDDEDEDVPVRDWTRTALTCALPPRTPTVPADAEQDQASVRSSVSSDGTGPGALAIVRAAVRIVRGRSKPS